VCGAHNIVGPDRTMKALEDQLAGSLGLDRLLNGCLNLAIDQDLPVMSVGTEPGSEVDHCSDRSVVETALEPDPAKGRVTMRDSHPEPELVTCPSPFPGEFSNLVAHVHPHFDGPYAGVRTWKRVVEQDHDGVAGKAFDRAFVLMDEIAKDRM